MIWRRRHDTGPRAETVAVAQLRAQTEAAVRAIADQLTELSRVTTSD